ncbi:hypothetical protein [Chryseobacterium indoltheticum]
MKTTYIRLTITTALLLEFIHVKKAKQQQVSMKWQHPQIQPL